MLLVDEGLKTITFSLKSGSAGTIIEFRLAWFVDSVAPASSSAMRQVAMTAVHKILAQSGGWAGCLHWRFEGENDFAPEE